MDISYKWLNDLIDTGYDVEETARQLTRVGLAVEGYESHGDDLVLDIDLTSNRSDCLSHRGIARELSVASRISLNDDVPNIDANASDLVYIEEPELCNRFTARIIRNVKVGPSPKWLVERLEALGERSINNVADITNYVMLEIGQPMHAFDLDKLAGGRIIVRKAKPGEMIRTLDDVERRLDESMVAVCDAEEPVAIGGVMGGLSSSITESTINVLLEVAYFDRSNIRATSRNLNLATEASYRFERGTDVMNLIRASERASDLICELAGGEKADFADVFPVKFASRSIISNDISASVKRLTGLSVEADECLRILLALGIGSSEITNGGFEFKSPSWRHDIAIEEDLVEEIARHAGYENIGDTLPPAFGAGEYQPNEHRERRLRLALADIGFDEALSYSFIDTRNDGVFELIPSLLDPNVEDKFVTLQHAVIEGAVRMRPSTMPGLLDAVRLNHNHRRRDVKLFEIGKVFAAKSSEDGLPTEQKAFGIVLTGGDVQEARPNSVRHLDFYDAKGAMELALDSIGISDVSFTSGDVSHLRPGQSAKISVHGKEVGYLGRLNDEIAASYKFKEPVYVGEINLTLVLSASPDPALYRPLSRYPGISRDVSFVVDRKLEFDEILKAIADQDIALCRSVKFVDIFEGKDLADNERSMTVRLEYRSEERTLIETEVEELHQTILSGIETKLGIRPRF